jgi:hypothetical protein
VRSISPTKIDDFLSILNDLLRRSGQNVKFPVDVVHEADDIETRDYANQIRELLNYAG